MVPLALHLMQADSQKADHMKPFIISWVAAFIIIQIIFLTLLGLSPAGRTPGTISTQGWLWTWMSVGTSVTWFIISMTAVIFLDFDRR